MMLAGASQRDRARRVRDTRAGGGSLSLPGLEALMVIACVLMSGQRVRLRMVGFRMIGTGSDGTLMRDKACESQGSPGHVRRRPLERRARLSAVNIGDLRCWGCLSGMRQPGHQWQPMAALHQCGGISDQAEDLATVILEISTADAGPESCALRQDVPAMQAGHRDVTSNRGTGLRTVTRATPGIQYSRPGMLLAWSRRNLRS
nr:hypothetical protein CFP56_21106 [Quercus suber]